MSHKVLAREIPDDLLGNVEDMPQRRDDSGRSRRGGRILLAWLAALLASPLPASPWRVTPPAPERHTRAHFRHTLAASVKADHPAILPVARAIRAVTENPLEQLVVVNDVAHLLVDYDDDERVYGAEEFHATFEEMLARRRQSGWLYLRDDCDGRAVFAAHLLAALGIEWRLEASYWKEHAWVVARVGGVDYDLLDLRPNAAETRRLSYKLFGRFFVRTSVRPPVFSWRRAWAKRTERNLACGLTLGLLAVGSTAAAPQERFATDWSVQAPGGRVSPAEDRSPGSVVAGFPFGEPLAGTALASAAPAPRSAASQGRGVATGSADSGGR